MRNLMATLADDPTRFPNQVLWTRSQEYQCRSNIFGATNPPCTVPFRLSWLIDWLFEWVTRILVINAPWVAFVSHQLEFFPPPPPPPWPSSHRKYTNIDLRTESQGVMIDNPASCFGATPFVSRKEEQLSLVMIMVFLSPARQIRTWIHNKVCCMTPVMCNTFCQLQC
jgi:hypothetical protein